MTKQKWTPGPWRAEGDDPAELIIWSSPENRVCFLAHSAGFNDDGDFANAHLIAAAPEMFDALKAVETWWLEIGMHEPGRLGAPAAIFMTRSVLAKAQGILPESPLWEGE